MTSDRNIYCANTLIQNFQYVEVIQLYIKFANSNL